MQQSLHSLLGQLGITLSDDALLFIVALLTGFIGFLFARGLYKRQQVALAAQFVEQQNTRQAAIDDQMDQLSHTFSTLSQKALQLNNESFLHLAKQSFSQLQSSASHELKAREQSFTNLLSPIQQSIQATDQQLRKLDSDRKMSEVRFSEQISNLLQSQHSLQSETRNLVTALRRPEVRGQWGELTLRRLVELAGMSEHCDFYEQITVNTPDGQLRPDMLIQLPSDRQLVVDVKTSLNAYINATEASDDETQHRFLQQHCKNIKQRIKELSQKQYWQQFSKSPDFVILFIPGDQFLSAALDQDKNLLEFALDKRILLATPTSLVGLLRTIAYGWNQQTLSENSEQIRVIGESLYQRLLTLTEHLNKLGKNLDQGVEQFNKVVGSFENNTLSAARKLSALGVGSGESIQTDKANAIPTRRIKPSK